MLLSLILSRSLCRIKIYCKSNKSNRQQARGSSSSHNTSMATVPLLPYESATVPLLPYLVMKQEEPEKEEKYREGLEEGQLMMSPLRGDGVGPGTVLADYRIR